MSGVVFVWPMGGRDPRGHVGVGHASLFISGKFGSAYISFWPAAHNFFSALSSPGKIHFMNGDRISDGTPKWASKPLVDLNDAAVINWWSHIQRDPLINYGHKKPFQSTKNQDSAFQMASNTQYRLLNSQCSTMVVAALIAGSNPDRKIQIRDWLKKRNVNIGPFEFIKEFSVILRYIGTITPTDVKNLISEVWGDN